MALRLQAMGVENYKDGFKLAIHEQSLSLPLSWKKPQMIFINSMSDIFHRDVPDEFIQRIFEVMKATPWHTYQILTKRAERLDILDSRLDWPENAWMGVTIENPDYTYRVNHLKNCHAKVKFISFEPLLSEITQIDLSGIDWAIVGGESGPKSRPILKEWVLRIKDICERDQVAFYFKQWGGINKKKAGNLLDGVRYQAFPIIHHENYLAS
jgi:protein gp37